MTITLIHADYDNEQHASDLVMLLNAYALDPMGGGEPLSEHVKQNLVASLAKRSDVFTVLCYVDDKPAGIINCVEGFSTFKCKPLINIHDCGVLSEYRGMGISGLLFDEVEKIAKQKGCCKLTLEVLEGNIVAQNAYKKLGFAGYELDEKMGKAMFWEKKLS
ncbi:GNAT family N-acetyltransferase [Litorilituus lipolyticus]|uniref:GNAT family N-acetyltransferase n=1 Tax=Litorilituus lipolyticus TaxID=2491017 RepID=A0A502KX92_9GAMM|nr:GNAT family N-acetyltransferase [Litorilituus lipolyticus]TPH14571.1 GNAT family N-acetyltransferase [Litorilituus lipolyticus]